MTDQQIVKRNPENPILTINDLEPSYQELKVVGVFNPGATTFGDETILLARVSETVEPEEGWAKSPIMQFDGGEPRLKIMAWKEDGPNELDTSDPRKFKVDGRFSLTSISHLRLARSKDGVHFTFDSEPFLSAHSLDEALGVEDCRITRIDDVYYITYTAVSRDGHCVGLATTKDFVAVERHGLILPPANKDSCIFPEKIGDVYAILHRPLENLFSKPSIWYAESPDLIHWGDHYCLLRPNENYWEEIKIGAGPEPIKTSEGWLLLYHGSGHDSIYSHMLCLLDLEDPRKILKRSNAPIIIPEDKWEKEGFFPNVVFSNGWVRGEDGGIRIYYGAADDSICLAETTEDELLNSLN